MKCWDEFRKILRKERKMRRERDISGGRDREDERDRQGVVECRGRDREGERDRQEVVEDVTPTCRPTCHPNLSSPPVQTAVRETEATRGPHSTCLSLTVSCLLTPLTPH